MTSDTRTSLRYLTTGTGVAGLGATALAWWMTPRGAGISPDSVIYLGIARSVLDGHGFVFDGGPVTHFPPGYALMLAAVSTVCGSVVTAARVLAAFWLGANVFLVGASVAWGTRRAAPTVAALLLFTLSGSVLYVHAMAWTEAPFFFFTLAGLLGLAAWVGAHRQWQLMTSAACFAAAMLTRYVGVVDIVPLVAATLLLRGGAGRERLRHLVMAGAVATTPLLLWLVRDRVVARQATDRVLAVHLVDGPLLQQMFNTLNDYLLPLDMPSWSKIAFVLLIGSFVIAGCRQALHRPQPRGGGDTLGLLLALFAVAYLSFVLLSISFADATTPLDDRILFPAFGSVATALVLFAWNGSRTYASRRLWWVFEAAAAGSLLVRVGPSVDGVQSVRNDGVGYASSVWQQSEMLARVKLLPAGMTVYSNAQDAIEFLLGRDAQWLPDDLIWESMQPNPAYDAQREAMCRDVLGGTAVVAYFNTEDRDNEWALSHTKEMCDFPFMDRADDGAFYSAAGVRM